MSHPEPSNRLRSSPGYLGEIANFGSLTVARNDGHHFVEIVNSLDVTQNKKGPDRRSESEADRIKPAVRLELIFER